MSLNQIVNPKIDADFKSLKVNGVEVSGGETSVYTPTITFPDGEMTINSISYNYAVVKESQTATNKFYEVYCNIFFQGTFNPVSGVQSITCNLSLPFSSDGSDLVSGALHLSQNGGNFAEIFTPIPLQIEQNNLAIGFQGNYTQTTTNCALVGSFIYRAPL